jgi:hypothetical protein
LSKTGGVVLAAVLAIAGFAASSLWTFAKDKTQEPVTVVLGREGGAADHSYALPEVIPEAEGGRLGQPQELFSDSPLRRRATKVLSLGAKLTVEGANSHTVVITDVRARILNREPVVGGTLLSAPPQGVETVIKLGFDLDQQVPTARVVKGGEFGDPYFENNTVTLKDHEVVTFMVDARAAKAAYTWNIEVDLVVDGQAMTRSVAGPDGPFKLTGAPARYGAAYQFVPPDSWQFFDPAGGCPGPGLCR